MDEQNGKFVERRKEARSKLSDAREKVYKTINEF